MSISIDYKENLFVNGSLSKITLERKTAQSARFNEPESKSFILPPPSFACFLELDSGTSKAMSAFGSIESNLGQIASTFHNPEEYVDIQDCVALFIQCSQHKKVGLQKLRNGKDLLWFPTANLTDTDRPFVVADKLLSHFLKTKTGQAIEYTRPMVLQTYPWTRKPQV